MLKVQEHETGGISRFLYQSSTEIYYGRTDEKECGKVAKNFYWIQKKSSEKQTVDQDCEERNHDVMDDAEAALVQRKWPIDFHQI